MNKAPSISVVVPVYNTERFLGEAIESILRQTRPVNEVVVVDDGSTDGSGDVARRYPEVRCLRQANAGQAAARNRGVAEAGGELLAFLDADDVWMPEKIERQVAALGENPEIGVVFGHGCQFADPSTGDPGGLPPPPSAPRPAHLPGAMLVRREAFQRIGPYRADYALAEVVEWYARALGSGVPILTLPDLVLMRRIHGQNIGRTKRHARPEYLSAVRAAVRRHRQGNGDGQDSGDS